MRGKEFVGEIGVKQATPSGGEISVAFGKLTSENDEVLDMIAFQIIDENKETVAEFALRAETFGTLLGCIDDLFHMTFDKQETEVTKNIDE